MELSSQQISLLKTDINNDVSLSGLVNNDDNYLFIAQQYSLESNPRFWVWRTNVPTNEIMNNGFIWSTVDSMTVGKARIWEWMKEIGYINPSKVNIRQGLGDAFGVGSAMANAITPHLSRPANRVEALFSTGTGTSGSPGTMTFEGDLNYQDVRKARES